MYCPDCNYEGGQGEYLCRNCGSPLKNRVTRRPKSELQARVIESLKASIRSPLFVVAIVMYTIAIVLRLITDIDSESTFEICLWLDLDESMGWLVSVVNTLPGMITTVGLWILLVEALGSHGMGTAGLKVLMASEIVGLISLLWVPVGVYAGLSYSYAGNELGLFLWPIMIGMMIFGIILGVKKISVIRIVRETAESAMPDGALSGLVGVMTIIAGAGGLMSIFTDFSLDDLLSGGALLMFGIHFFIYRTTMADLEMESTSYDLGDGGRNFFIRQPTAPATQKEHVPAWKQVEASRSETDHTM